MKHTEVIKAGERQRDVDGKAEEKRVMPAAPFGRFSFLPSSCRGCGCRITQRHDPVSHLHDRLTETLLLSVCLPSKSNTNLPSILYF